MAKIDHEIAKTQEERKKMEKQLAFLTSVTYDTEFYGAGVNRYEGYESSIPVTEEDDENIGPGESKVARKLASYTAPKFVMKDMLIGCEEDNDMGFNKPAKKIIDREDDYKRRKLNRMLSPDRNDAFAMGDKTPDASVRTYSDVMRENALARERLET